MAKKPETRDPNEALRQILAFAASAGVSITNRDALEVIKNICRARLHGDERARALADHAVRAREILYPGVPEGQA